MERRYVLTEEEVAMVQGMSLRIEQLQEENDKLLKLNNERIVLKNKVEQLEKENNDLRSKLKGLENRLNLSKLHIELLRGTLDEVRAEHEGLKAVSQPVYTAVITIDSWHCDGKHFPFYYGVVRGNTRQEAYDNALMQLRSTYKLTDVHDKAVMGSNFLYAGNREANIIITKTR